MKKIVLFLFGFTLLTGYSQIEIRKPGETQDISGTTITENVTLNDVPADDEWAYWGGSKFHVFNLSGSDQKFRLKRVRVSVPSDWDDQICWPPTCYPTSGAMYLTPNTVANPAPIIYDGGSTTDLDGAVAEIKPQIYPGQPGSSATYRYIVTDATGDTHYDSITVVINYVNNLSISSVQKSVELTMSPNPATDYVMINAEGMSDAKIRVVDVLGNVVYTSEFNSAKKLSVTEFKSGVYFVTVQGESNKGFTKKLVVRH